jgi:hypothetical protein
VAVVSNAHDVSVLDPGIGDKIVQLEVPPARGRFGPQTGQVSGEVAELGIVRSFVHLEGLDGVDRNIDRVTPGDRVHHFRGIDQQHALVLRGALDVDLPIGGAHHTWHEGQGSLEFLLHERQSDEFRRTQARGRSATFLGYGRRRFVDLDLLSHYYRIGQNDSHNYTRRGGDFQTLLYQRQVIHGCAREIVFTRRQARICEFPSLAGGHGDALDGQAVPPQGADGASNGQVFRAQHHALQILRLGERPPAHDGDHQGENQSAR